MGRPNRYENDSYAGFMRRAVRAFGRRAAEDTDALAMLVQLRAELDAEIEAAARLCHDGPAGFSWTEIGSALGISRQAARQRFSPSPAELAERRASIVPTCGHAICAGRATCAFRQHAAQKGN